MKVIDNKKILIVANWKMYLDMHDSSLYLHKLNEEWKTHRNIETIIAPSLFALQSLSMQVNLRKFKLAAQNLYWRDSGAFTGEVSASQLKGIVQYAIIGHSERRNFFHETDKDVRYKVQAALRNGITPILCIGENLFEKNNGEAFDVIRDQLIGGLANVTSEEVSRVVIAYEPVWAIGTGSNAVPADIKEALRVIRCQIKELYGDRVSKTLRVLYGGSINSCNVSEYLNIEDLNGILVGASSLNFNEFRKINEIAFQKIK